MSITDTAAPGKDNILSIHSLKQMLIIDDEPELLPSIWSKLEDNDCLRVQNACGSKNALEFLEGDGSNLLSIDLEIPKMDGMEPMVVTKKFFLEIFNIVMTDFGFQIIEQQLKKANVLHVLPKPSILKNAVHNALHACNDQQFRFLEQLHGVIQS